MEKAKKGCLVLHGLTSTPATMHPIIEALEAGGYRVETPLLAGHGADLQTLAASTAKDWYASLMKAYQALSARAERIYVVGLSMGAILGLKMAEEMNAKITALALLSPPLRYTPIFRFLIMPGIRYTPLRWFIRSTAKNFEKSLLDPVEREYYRANSLARIPCNAVIELLNLTKEVKKNLGKINRPLLVMQGRKDHLVDPRGLLQIKKGVGSKTLELVLLSNSSHILSLDYDRNEVAKRIVDFFETANGGQTR